MKVTGVITEYNPFHNGHLYHLQQSRKVTGGEIIIAVMSGNYVQRGAPAAFDKYIRTKSALLAGVDMVIELPLYYATASAEFFASGAVRILAATGIVQHLCFGSESGDIKTLEETANILTAENAGYTDALKKQLALGLSFPSAREKAFAAISKKQHNILASPNNILAVEYIKALKSINSGILPYTITRRGAGYNDESLMEASGLSSATAIRKAMATGDLTAPFHFMPETSGALIKEAITAGEGPVDVDGLSPYLNFRLRSITAADLANIMDIEEGLENRIIECCGKSATVSSLLNLLKTKRYPYSRLSRALLHCILGITKEDFHRFEQQGGPQYIRVLGFRRESRHIFKALETQSRLPIVTNLKDAPKRLNKTALSMLDKEIMATDIYYLATPNSQQCPKQKHYEYKMPLVIV